MMKIPPAAARGAGFVSMDENLRRLPVALLSGFLGSGKTTLVNALLRDPRLADTAVAINEFGDVPLDRHMVENGLQRTIQLANGCLCCNVGGDMADAVLRIFARRQEGSLPRFARLLIEPSGLADPAPIAQAILRNPVMSRAFRLETIICTVDSGFAERQLARHTEARKQVALADRIVLTKPDTADAATRARVRVAIARLNPLASIAEAEHGNVDAAALLPPGWLYPDLANPPSAGRSAFFAEGAPSHEAPTLAVSLSAEAPLDWRRFDAWLRDVRIRHADNLLRIKGVLRIAGAGAPLAIQGVHHVLQPPVELADWPGGQVETRLSILTQGVARGVLEASWEAAMPGMLAESRKELLF